MESVRERITTPLNLFSRLLGVLAGMALVGVMATASMAAEGDTALVSVDASGNQANGASSSPSISSQGRYVAFSSSSWDLVPYDTNEQGDVFVRDRQTGTTQRVSVDRSGNQANGGSGRPSVSSDGRYVAFASLASNLVPNDTNAKEFRYWSDVFVHDRHTGTTERVNVSSSGEETKAGSSNFPDISPDGRYVAFWSNASNLVENDTNDRRDIFVHDRHTGTTKRVSVNTSGTQANRGSGYPSISAGGRFVAFRSGASNLVANDANDGEGDAYVRDRQTGTTRLVSVNSSGEQANDHTYQAAISSDGRHVVFTSPAKNLVADHTNPYYDVFLHERDTAAPRVTGVAPAEGATSIAPKASVVATFSERMDKSTLTKANFKLYKVIKNQDGTTTAKQIENVTVTPSSDGLKATLNPYGGSEELLAKNTRYKAVVSEGTLDAFGNPLDQMPSASGNQPKVWFFETRS